jgi:drug/metabolite transporter (DMT)-like permease
MTRIFCPGSSIAYTTIRWIGKRAHPLISVNYFSFGCTVISCAVMAFSPGVGFLFPADLKEWSYLIFLGVCGFVMQFLLAAGLQYEKSSRATNMVYTQMLFALAFDKLFFSNTPGLLSIAGGSLILGSAIYVAVRKGREREKGDGATRAADEEAQQGLISGAAMEMEEQRERSRTRFGEMESEDQRPPFEEVQLRALRN